MTKPNELLTPIPEQPHDSQETTVAAPSQTVVDPRIDKLITWTLMLAASIALAVGAWFFSGLQHSIDSLQKEIVELKVALSKVEADRRDIDELKKRFDELERYTYRLGVTPK